MTASPSIPPAARIASLRSRRADVADEITRCEARVRRMREELEAGAPAGRQPSAVGLAGGMRDLLTARARLAQIQREMRRAARR